MANKQNLVETVSQQQVDHPIDPRLLAAMNDMLQEDEIDLFEYWAIIRKRKWLILYSMLAAAIVSAGISLFMPNVYEAQVLMAPVDSNQTSSAGLTSALSGGSLGALASVAGIDIGSSSSRAAQNLAVLQSRAFLWNFIKENKLMPILYAGDWVATKKTWKASFLGEKPSLWDAYRYFIKGKFPVGRLLHVSTDPGSGVVKISVDWIDPVQAADWANQLVTRLNNHLRNQAIVRIKANIKYLNEALQKTSVAEVQQALFALIVQEQKKAMIANTQRQYAFEVLDAAVPPDKQIRPNRVWIVIIAMLVTGFLAIIIVFAREGRIKRTRSKTDQRYSPLIK